MKYHKKNKKIHIWEEDSLRSDLHKILKENDLSKFRVLVRSIAAELEIDFLDCAAALVSLNQSNFRIEKHPEKEKNSTRFRQQASEGDRLKLIRYRLEVGHKHQISVEIIKTLLVEETGVEKKLIGYIDIHNYYSLIRLPEGMPADIFNHLKAVKINRQALGIKRLGRNSRKPKREKTLLLEKQQGTQSANKQNNRVRNTTTRMESRGVNRKQKD